MFAMDERQKFLNHLRIFVGIEGMENLKQAANQLGISRNTLRSHLTNFNKMLECDMTIKGVKKTSAGERIAPEASHLLEEIEASLDAARTRLKRLARPQSPVQVAMSPTIWMWGAESELLPLTHTLPKLPRRNAVEFLVANSERVERAVSDGWFELGITARHPSRKLHQRLAHRPFCSDEIVLAVPPQHDWSDAKHVAVDNLEDTQLIMLDTSTNARLVVDHALKDSGLELADPYEEVAMAAMAFDEVLNAGVPALVSRLAFESPQGRSASERGIHQCKVSGVDLSREFILVHEKRLREEADAVMKALLMIGS